MGKHGCKKIPIFLRNKRTRMFSLMTALLATIAIVVGNGVISGAYAFDDIPTYISNYSGCGAVGNYKRLLSVDDDITYCVDTHDLGTLITDTTWGPVINNRDVAIAAMMIKLNVSGRYGSSNYRDRVAIAYAIHEHFEDKDKWNKAKQNSFNTKDFSEIASKADELWNEAANKIPTKVLFENNYGTSGSSGEIKVKAEGITRTAYSGNDGVDFKITASNENIKFKDNYYNNNSELKEERKGFIRTDKDYSDDFVWVATGEGKVDINGEYYLPNLDRRDTKKGCYLLRLSQSPVKYNIDSSISINAHRDFYPTVTSKSEVKKLKLGDSVEGNVKSGVNYEDNKPWIKDKKIRARGYYFVGSHENILKERAAGSNVDDYLKELRADSNIRQVGASDVYFTKSGEEAKAVVHVTNGDMKPENLEKAAEYKVGEQDAGLFGTWVWTIAKNEQDNDVKDFVSSDFIEGFGKAQSTLTHIAKVNIKHVKNDKNKDSNEVSDTIIVSGAPKDYGMFKGNKEYGFDGDENMKVRLWWIGYENGTVDKESMSKLNPKSDKEPEEDDNHKKVGEWSIPLRNGVYTIANGKVMLKEASADVAGSGDSGGNTETGNGKEGSDLGKKVADIVNLKSGNSGESGMYVFVYDFPGSSRAEAFKTAFNDVDSKSVFNKQNVTNHPGKTGETNPGGANPGKTGETNPGKQSEPGNPGGVKPGKTGESNPGGGTPGKTGETNPGGVKPGKTGETNPGKQSEPGKTSDPGKQGEANPGKQGEANPGKTNPGGVKPGNTGEPGKQGDVNPGKTGETNPDGGKPGSQSQSGNTQNGGKQSGENVQNDGTQNGTQNGKQNTSQNGNQNGTSSSENTNSGNVTSNEIDPVTHAGGAVVDNIISKQGEAGNQNGSNAQGSGNAQNGAQSGVSAQGSGNAQSGTNPGTNSGVNTQPGGNTQNGVNTHQGGNSQPGAQPGGNTHQSGNAQSGAQSGTQSGAQTGGNAQSGTQTGGNSQSGVNTHQGGNAQSGVSAQGGGAQGSGNAQNGTNPGTNSGVNAQPGGNTQSGTQSGGNSQSGVNTNQAGNAQSSVDAQSGVNTQNLGTQNGVSSTSKQNSNEGINQDAQNGGKNVENNESKGESKSESKNESKGESKNESKTEPKGKSKNESKNEQKNESKNESKVNATKNTSQSVKNNSKKEDLQGTQNNAQTYTDSTAQAQDSRDKENGLYANESKNTRHRRYRLGMSQEPLVNAGVKIQSVLMFALSALLISGAVVLAKRVSYSS